MNNDGYGQQLFLISSSTYLFFLTYRMLYVQDSEVNHPEKHWESNQEFIMFAIESYYTKKAAL